MYRYLKNLFKRVIFYKYLCKYKIYLIVYNLGCFYKNDLFVKPLQEVELFCESLFGESFLERLC